jgi:hypothetical protein
MTEHMRISRFAILVLAALALFTCRQHHRRHIVDLWIRAKVTHSAQAPVTGAQVTLSDLDAPTPLRQNHTICVTDAGGTCDGRLRYGYATTRVLWWGQSNERKGSTPGRRLFINISAPGFDTAAVRLSTLTHDEIAGRTPIQATVDLQPARSARP